MSVHYVYRLVVDSWPTENGEPFAYQGYDFWESIVEAHRAGEPVPSWLPADFGEWVAPDPDEVAGDPFASTSPKRSGYSIAWHDAPDYATGYGGEGHLLMNVPHATRMRRFSKSSLLPRLEDLRAWGCEVRIECAPIGEWEDVA